MSETCRVLYEINFRSSASRWLSLYEYITIHGPINVRTLLTLRLLMPYIYICIYIYIYIYIYTHTHTHIYIYIYIYIYRFKLVFKGLRMSKTIWPLPIFHQWHARGHFN